MTHHLKSFPTPQIAVGIVSYSVFEKSSLIISLHGELHDHPILGIVAIGAVDEKTMRTRSVLNTDTFFLKSLRRVTTVMELKVDIVTQERLSYHKFFT